MVVKFHGSHETECRDVLIIAEEIHPIHKSCLLDGDMTEIQQKFR